MLPTAGSKATLKEAMAIAMTSKAMVVVATTRDNLPDILLILLRRRKALVPTIAGGYQQVASEET
jgi:hypothetical protein